MSTESLSSITQPSVDSYRDRRRRERQNAAPRHSNQDRACRPTVLYVIFLATLLVTCSFLLQGRIDINLADECYLWYGTLRTALGEMPLRDFQSYFPGRYYWTAAWSFILGDGIMDLRLSVAIFQAIGLSFGLLAARTVLPNRWLLILAAAVLIFWMLPRDKIFEHSLSMASVYFGTVLLRETTKKGCFFSGAFVGLAAAFGPNHALYASSAHLLLLLFLWWKLGDGLEFLKNRFLFWLAGLLIGTAPITLLAIFVDGFFESVIANLLTYVRLQTTNLTIPAPWPWVLNLTAASWLWNYHRLLIGITFVCLPLFIVLGILVASTTTREQIYPRALFISCTATGLFYMHHVFARADFHHLAEGIHPLILGCIAAPSCVKINLRKWLISLLAIFIVAITALGASLGNYYVMMQRHPKPYLLFRIGDDHLRIPPASARWIEGMEEIAKTMDPHKGLLALPRWPGFYCILGQKSPIWELYLTYPETETRQREMIVEITDNNVQWALVDNRKLDGREDRQLSNTNKILWEYITRDFEPVEASWLPRGFILLQRKSQAMLVPLND